MFRKLKQKIEEKDNVDLTIDLSTTNASSSSSISLSGSECSPLKISSSQESLSILSTVAQQTPTRGNDSNSKNRHFEKKTIEESSKSKEKVNERVQIETQQHFTTDSKSISEQKLLTKIQILMNENDKLEAKTQELTSQIQRMVAKQDSNEELDGFQNQEMSKIKHLLLLSQQSLVKKEEEEMHFKETLSASKNKIHELELEIHKSKDELASVKTLQLEKQHLELEVDRLKQDSLKSATRSAHMEKTLGDLTDEYDAVKHMYEIYKSKNSTILDEKDNELSHLNERLKFLEKRVESSELDGDDKLQALLLERKKMEEKLEESFQHTKEVKSNWSEKIHNLETQIFHLNKKMAEDSEDSGRSEKELEELTKETQLFREKNWKLDEQVSDLQIEIERVKKEKDEMENILSEKLKDRENELLKKLSNLEHHISDIVKENSKEKQDLQSKMSELVSLQTENVEKEIEVERQMTEMEGENRKLKADLIKEEKECSKLNRNLEMATSSLKIAEKKLEKLESECSGSALVLQECQKTLQQEQTQLKEIIRERDTLMMRNAELSHRVKMIDQDLDEEKSVREREKEDYERQFLTLKLENEELSQKVSEFEKGVVDQEARESVTVKQHDLITKLEEQLNDRNKTIKLQQKRLTDMKKTLQKELKVQGGGTDSINDISQLLADSSANHISASSSEFISNRKQNANNDLAKMMEEPLLSNKQELVSYDEVNFRYLRHVVFKFMTSPEYEAQHLIRAVSVLLRFNRDEEKFIRETLDWKMSWFGSKPQPSREAKRPKAPILSSAPR